MNEGHTRLKIRRPKKKYSKVLLRTEANPTFKIHFFMLPPFSCRKQLLNKSKHFNTFYDTKCLVFILKIIRIIVLHSP